MTISAGKLDRTITIQRATTVPNEFNEPIETWADLKRIRAGRRDVSDGEKAAAGQIGAFRKTMFRVRYNAGKDIQPTDRIEHEGVIYQIEGIKEPTDARRRTALEITAIADAD